MHLDGARQEPSAQADITFSVPRIHSPGLGAGDGASNRADPRIRSPHHRM
ncbi:hypothetical protein [Longimicrobium sp.]|nr:hypothetical protein [Longimicrobium sp.]HEX6038945.1 hypothetical protein [Longimicrobium sp.]